jgi:formylglycine-generating enzyme required for sulfatase activity
MRVILLMLACLLAQSLGAQSYTGKSYALFFANNDYSGNPEFDSLRNPIKDAEAIAKELREMYGYTEVKVLKDQTKQQIISELERWQARQFKPQDQLFVFFSGHGSFRTFSNTGYFVPNTSSSDYDAYLSLIELSNAVSIIKTPHILLCIDACYSGTIDQEIAFKGREYKRPGATLQTEREELLSDLLRNKSRLLLTSGGKERTPDGTEHSPLAEAILNALRAAYSHGDRLLTYTELLGKMERVKPIPHYGDFVGHEQGNFVFIAKTAVTPPTPPEPPPSPEETSPDPIQQLSNNMVRVDGGSFTMGCKDGRDKDCFDDEMPTRTVQVSTFSIGKYEVTQAQWRAVMGSDPSKNKGCDNCPVEQVSWYDVRKFIEKLNTLTVEQYRLPTEAEWEYAARGGNQSKGYLYSGSNSIDEVAWYNGNYEQGNTHGEQKTTRPVGCKKPNELGLYDMSGNVWEWVQDCRHEDYRDAPRDGRAWLVANHGDCGLLFLRGGSWVIDARYCRSSSRIRFVPMGGHFSYGFRLARD